MGKFTESIKNVFVRTEPVRKGYSLQNLEIPKNFIKEQGKVDFDDTRWNSDTLGVTNKELAKKIKKVPYNYDLFLSCYKNIPKVFRAINTRANFAIQSGCRLIGEESDVDKIDKWERKVHFDNNKIQIAKEMLLYGNVYIQPMGKGDALELKFLPVTTMRVIRENTGQIVGYAQIYDRKLIAQWGPEEIIHIKWNSIGTEAYGIPELRCLVDVLDAKLDNETLIPKIIKYNLEPRVIIKAGSPEKPYSDAQISNFKGQLQNRIAGGDMIVPGDITIEIIQPMQGGADSAATLINHIENQINTGLNLPQILIEGRSDAQGSMIQMDALERDVKTIQDVMGLAIEKYIYTRLLGKEDVPTIVWNPMNIETALRESRTLRQLVGDFKSPNIITVDEAREQLGYMPMPEKEKNKPLPLFGGDEPNKPGGGSGPNEPKKPVAGK